MEMNPKMPRRRRVSVRLTDGEYLAVTKKAADVGYTESELIRKALLGISDRKERKPIGGDVPQFYEHALVIRTLIERIRVSPPTDSTVLANKLDAELRALQQAVLAAVGEES